MGQGSLQRRREDETNRQAEQTDARESLASPSVEDARSSIAHLAEVHMSMTKRQALEILTECGGHAYLTPGTAKNIADAFGVKITMMNKLANTGEFKGLEVADVPPNTRVKGYDADSLAVAIANSYTNPALDQFRAYKWQEGRGSRHRSACQTIDAALKMEGL